MTEYAKSVFNNQILLEQKLAIYLGDEAQAKKLAPTFEKFFVAGNRQKLKSRLTWSWWGLLNFGFLFRYKLYVDFVMYFISFIIVWKFIPAASIGVVAGIIVGSKFSIAKQFLKALEAENDEVLKNGKNPIWLSIIVFIVANVLLACAQLVII